MKSVFANGVPARQRGGLRRCARIFRTVCFPVFLIVAAASIWGYASAQVARAAQTGGSSTGNIQNGKRIFAAHNCIECHGSEGQGGSAQVAGPRIGPTTLPLAMFIEKIRDPMKPMPAFASTVVSDAELADVYAFLKSIPAPAQTDAAAAGNVENGRRIYRAAGCYECHDTVGQGGAGTGPRLAPDPIQFTVFAHQVRLPVDQMPPYTSKVLPDSELADIYAFLRSVPKPPSVQSIPLLK
jgi:mono/diheme cytochrome c family protein